MVAPQTRLRSRSRKHGAVPPRSRLAPKPGSAGEGKRPDLSMKMDEIVREAGWDWPTGGAPTARRPVARAGRGYADPQAVARSADKQPAAAMLEGRLGARGRWRRRRRCSASFCPPDPGAIIRLWNGCGRPESPPAHRAARSAPSAYPAPLPSAWRRQRAGQAAPRRWRRRRCGGCSGRGALCHDILGCTAATSPPPAVTEHRAALAGHSKRGSRGTFVGDRRSVESECHVGRSVP